MSTADGTVHNRYYSPVVDYYYYYYYYYYYELVGLTSRLTDLLPGFGCGRGVASGYSLARGVQGPSAMRLSIMMALYR
ncbi:hypothetical protein N7539_005765 [Penicillium diatomitis]|uniref:Uncharacterized protein n=1 Tax=Penicillium diatomitis TaxID=2819901 RepID=A0A9X0BUA3_9EURO|nr:uncharacterized protein N7539_005765 [Penicillium diatomitis]KAJ5483969.1 hypothetical protein N7539_005765 [Penicillium diatomitis]